MSSDSLFGLVVMSALVGLGAVAVAQAQPSSPAASTEGISNILAPIGSLLLGLLLLTVAILSLRMTAESF